MHAPIQGQGYLLFKPETSSPPGAEASTEFGGRRTRWECAVRMMRIWKAQKPPPGRLTQQTLPLPC